jgi:glutathione S-transferase
MNDPSEGSPRPVLGYWKIRGLASAIRYQLVYSGVPFDEEVYEQGNGPDFSRAAWDDVKCDLGLTYPNLPYFKDGEYSLTEPSAIHRYIARKWCPDLLCHDDAELYGRAEMAWGVVSDLNNYVTARMYRDDDKRAISVAVIPRLAPIAEELKGKGVLIGDRLCCADFAFVELVEKLNFVSDGGIFRVFPSIKRYRDRVFALRNLKEYLENLERCPRLPFNNKEAKINNS